MIHYFSLPDTATTEIYTLSLHDALPILSGIKTTLPFFREIVRDDEFLAGRLDTGFISRFNQRREHGHPNRIEREDRKSTRLNSSHLGISYAVFCLKKKNI